jgi:EAL domain-containing protein (putative c-di-GMP-specific phosphodiesterase class I)
MPRWMPCGSAICLMTAAERLFAVGESQSINRSGRHFRKNTLMTTIVRVLKSTGMDPRLLELELTEGILMDSGQVSMSPLRNLKERGITLSLDDFGTGYFSLSYLKRFPIDVLKTDRSFVKDILTDPDSASITSARIAMCKILKL